MDSSLIYPSYIALVGGSFDPFHKGHLHIGLQILQRTAVQRVIYLPCGNHNFKKDSIVLDFERRYMLIQKALDTMPCMEVWDADASTKSSGYTSDLLQKLYCQYPQQSFCFVIGSDNLVGISKWHNYPWLEQFAEFLVLPRPGFPIQAELLGKLRYQSVSIPLCDISSTDIKNRLANNISIRNIVPESIEAEVYSFYKDTKPV